MKKLISLFALLFCIGGAYAQETKLDTTVTIQGHSFNFRTDTLKVWGTLLLTIRRDSKTILTDTIGYITDYGLMNFNYDGYTGLIIGCGYMTNYPSTELYLFDSSNNSFKYIPEFLYYQSTQRLESDTIYYFTYSHTGCADLNWFSDLFVIKDFKVIVMGSISGEACDEDSAQWGISIYKGNSDDTTNLPIEHLPYSKNIPDNSYKWDFIKNYWNANYKKFL